MAACKHEWRPCATPPENGTKWYRCAKCEVFAYKRRSKITPYRCQVQQCGGLAIDRLPGRGARASFKWRCRTHVATESIVAPKA